MGAYLTYKGKDKTAAIPSIIQKRRYTRRKNPPALSNRRALFSQCEQTARADAQATKNWNELTVGKKRMFTFHVTSAKTALTEQKRTKEAIEAILKGLTLRELKNSNK